MLTYPTLRYIETHSNDEWELTADYVKDEFVIPKGFTTDLASVPRVFWSLIPPFGKWIPAVVVHDWLYRTGNNFSRREADKVLLRILLKDKINKFLAYTMFVVVRVFGKPRWFKHKIK